MAKKGIMAKIDIEAIVSRLERDRQIAFKKWEYHRANDRPNNAYCFWKIEQALASCIKKVNLQLQRIK